MEAIRAAESAGYNVIIIDSLSHAWAGPGGVLDIHGYAADKGGNSWSVWQQVTPQHNELVDTMLQSRCHIIATLRSKMEYVQVVENGKTVIKKVGMNPIQRDKAHGARQAAEKNIAQCRDKINNLAAETERLSSEKARLEQEIAGRDQAGLIQELNRLKERLDQLAGTAAEFDRELAALEVAGRAKGEVTEKLRAFDGRCPLAAPP